SYSTGLENESWVVNYEWTSELAWISRVLDIQFVYTSSVMVFSQQTEGPFTIFSKPDCSQGYGYEKRLAEERVFYQNPQSIVCRLGWQIDTKAGSNNMIDFLEKQMQYNGHIRASTKWYPACSFLEDTVKAMYSILMMRPGLYQINSNEKWSFYEIVNALKERLKKNWKVSPSEDLIYDQRMLDERVDIPSLRTRLPLQD
ncbi:MAG: sugar nucleotide-binding protein, partial [Spirochaetia bacterium]